MSKKRSTGFRRKRRTRDEKRYWVLFPNNPYQLAHNSEHKSLEAARRSCRGFTWKHVIVRVVCYEPKDAKEYSSE